MLGLYLANVTDQTEPNIKESEQRIISTFEKSNQILLKKIEELEVHEKNQDIKLSDVEQQIKTLIESETLEVDN